MAENQYPKAALQLSEGAVTAPRGAAQQACKGEERWIYHPGLKSTLFYV